MPGPSRAEFGSVPMAEALDHDATQPDTTAHEDTLPNLQDMAPDFPFAAWIESYLPLVYRQANSMYVAAGEARVSTDDLAQEALLYLCEWAAANQASPDCLARPALIRDVAHKRMIDHLRSRGALKRGVIDAAREAELAVQEGLTAAQIETRLLALNSRTRHVAQETVRHIAATARSGAPLETNTPLSLDTEIPRTDALTYADLIAAPEPAPPDPTPYCSDDLHSLTTAALQAYRQHSHKDAAVVDARNAEIFIRSVTEDGGQAGLAADYNLTVSMISKICTRTAQALHRYCQQQGLTAENIAAMLTATMDNMDI